MCNKQYIGQTSNHLRIRMTGHRFDIFHCDKEKPLAQHAIEHGKEKLEECFNLKAVNHIKSIEDDSYKRFQLKKLEQAHQLVLKTKYPMGLNLR